MFVGLLTLVAWAVTWRALPWLRAGSYRYPEERGRVIPSHTWTVPASVGVTALVGSVWGERPAHAVVFAAFAVFLVLISAIDLDVQRLPDRWTKPAVEPGQRPCSPFTRPTPTVSATPTPTPTVSPTEPPEPEEPEDVEADGRCGDLPVTVVWPRSGGAPSVNWNASFLRSQIDPRLTG